MKYSKIKTRITMGFFLLGSIPVAAQKNKISDKPNIIFILADDLEIGDVGCYGSKIIKTPNIDRLAKQGLKFTSHYSGGPVSAPSRCCLLTGKLQVIQRYVKIIRLKPESV